MKTNAKNILKKAQTVVRKKDQTLAQDKTEQSLAQRAKENWESFQKEKEKLTGSRVEKAGEIEKVLRTEISQTTFFRQKYLAQVICNK